MRRLLYVSCLLCVSTSVFAATTVAPVAAAPAAPAVRSPVGCKLIKASAYSYAVDKTGPITDATLPALLGEQGEGYGVASASTDTQDGNRDAGYVWHSGNEVIIAFRGTLPYSRSDTDTSAQMSSIEDWINDANAKPKADPELGQVHGGFEAAFENLWPGMIQQIKAWQAAGKVSVTPQIYVTGHSKGGALAMLAAVKLKAAKLPVTEVDTFGAPRVGGADFAAKYVGINAIRYENEDDLVPHVPLNNLELSLAPLLRRVIDIAGSPSGDYVSVGKLKYIDSDGSIQTPPDAAAEDELERARLAEFAPMIFESAQDISDTLIGAHSIGDMSATDDSRYFQAVCGKP